MHFVFSLCLLLPLCYFVQPDVQAPMAQSDTQVSKAMVHHRSRRSVAQQPTSGDPEFEFNKISPAGELPVVKIGEKLKFSVVIWFPKMTTNLHVEISTSTTPNGGVLSLCSPTITTVGSNIKNIDKTVLNTQWIKHSSANNGLYDRITLDLGTANIEDQTANVGAYKMTFNYEAILLNEDHLVCGSNEHWISFGARYMNNAKIWVGQQNFLCNKDDTVADWGIPTFEMTGPSELRNEETGVYKLKMFLPRLINDLILDVYAPNNATTKMSICHARVAEDATEVGGSYQCSPKEGKITKFNTGNDAAGISRAGMLTLDLGSVVNQVKRIGTPSAASDSFVVEVYARMLNTSTTGANYRLSTAVQLGTANVFTGYVDTKCTGHSMAAGSAGTGTHTFSTWSSFESVQPSTYVSHIVNMTLAKGSSHRYILKMTVPHNQTGLISFASIKIVHVGKNFICKDTDFSDTSLLYLNSTNNDGINDYASFSLGMITNLGTFDDPRNNRIVAHVVLKLSNMSSDVTSVKTVVGVKFDNSLWVGNHQFAVTHGQVAYTGDKVAKVSLTNMMLSKTVTPVLGVGAQQLHHIDVVVPPGSQYNQMEVFVTATYDNERAVVSICSVKLGHIGDNMLGLKTKTGEKSSVEYISSADDGMVDLVVLKLTDDHILSNTGIYNYAWEKEKNVVRVEVVTVVNSHIIQNDSNLVNSSLLWVAAGVKLTPTALWVGQNSFSVANDVTTDNSTAESKANVTFEAVSNSLTLVKGGAYGIDVKLTTEPQAWGNYLLDSLVLNDTLTICSVQMHSAGKTQPCLSDIAETQYISNDGDNQMDRVVKNMQNQYNVGIRAKEYSQEDLSTSFRIVAQLRDVPSVVNSAKYSIFNAFYEDNAAVWTNSMEITASTASGNLASVEADFYGRNQSTSAIVGSSVVVVLDVYVPPGSNGPMQVVLTSMSPDKLHICEIRVVSAGLNVPCVNDSFLAATFTPGSNYPEINMKAELDLGVVPNVLPSGSTTKVAANLVRLEAVVLVKPVDEVAVNDGETLTIKAHVQSGSGNIKFNQQLELTASTTIPDISNATTPFVKMIQQQTDSNITTVDAGPTQSTVSVNIYESATFGMNLTLAEGFYDIKIEVGVETAATDDQARLHFSEARVSFWGDNIACRHKKNSSNIINTTSTLSNVHMDKLVFNFGGMGNTGLFKRYKWRKYFKHIDDSLQVMFDTFVTDALANTPGAVVPFTVNVTINNKVYAFTQSITVLAPSTNKALLDYSYDISGVETQPVQKGNEIHLNVLLKHTLDSRADALNVTLNMYLPYYIKYDTNTKHAGPDMTVTALTDYRGLVLFIPRLLQFDVCNISFAVHLDPDNLLPDNTGVFNTSINSDYGIIQLDKANNLAVLSYNHGMFVNHFMMEIPVCSEKLNLDSTTLMQDCQFSSSTSDGTNTAEKVRSNSGSFWASPQRGQPFYGSEFLQINFGNLTRVSKIRIFEANGKQLTNFTLQFSEEGILWFDTTDFTGDVVQEYNTGSFAGSPAFSDVQIHPPVDGRYIRLIPKTSSPATPNYLHSMQIEMYGCSRTTDKPMSDACVTTTKASDFYERGYLINPSSGYLYVCMITKIEGDVKCAMSQDRAASWISVDDNVANIRYLLKSNGQLFGTASDKNSRLRSDDGGLNWKATLDEEYSEVAAMSTDQVAKAIVFPFTVNGATPVANFATLGMQAGNESYSVDLNGFYRLLNGNYELRSSWGIGDWNSA